MLYSMQPLGFSRKKLWAQALKNSQKLLKVYIKKICNIQLSHKQPPLVHDKVISYGRSLSYKKQALTELINIITLRLLTYSPKIHSGWFQIEQCLENLIIIYIQCSHQAVALRNLRWHIKRQEDAPIGAQRHATSQTDFRTSTVVLMVHLTPLPAIFLVEWIKNMISKDSKN